MDTPAFLNEHQVAKLLGISVSFIRKDRRTHRRVPFVRLGGRILYDAERVRQALFALEEGGRVKQRRAPAAPSST